MKINKEQEIIKILFKDFLNSYNSRNISRLVGLSHAGAFKILKKLKEREIVKPKQIGKAIIYSINLDNPVAYREVEMALTIEAWNYKRWVEEFKVLEDKSDIVILFGSILINEKLANDIDILVVAKKNMFGEIIKIIKEKNEISNKKIHLILQSPADFKKDINSKNKAIIEIIKKGIVLFGQDNFRKSVKI